MIAALIGYLVFAVVFVVMVAPGPADDLDEYTRERWCDAFLNRRPKR